MKHIITALLLALALCAEVSAFDVSWQYTPNTEDGFRVYRKQPGMSDFALLAELDKTYRNLFDSERIDGTCYKVTAFNTFGESAPLTACAVMPQPVTMIILK